jgi:hypothetical protein
MVSRIRLRRQLNLCPADICLLEWVGGNTSIRSVQSQRILRNIFQDRKVARCAIDCDDVDVPVTVEVADTEACGPLTVRVIHFCCKRAIAIILENGDTAGSIICDNQVTITIAVAVVAGFLVEARSLARQL